jgi:hypothetical protein
MVTGVLSVLMCVSLRGEGGRIIGKFDWIIILLNIAATLALQAMHRFALPRLLLWVSTVMFGKLHNLLTTHWYRLVARIKLAAGARTHGAWWGLWHFFWIKKSLAFVIQSCLDTGSLQGAKHIIHRFIVNTCRGRPSSTRLVACENVSASSFQKKVCLMWRGYRSSPYCSSLDWKIM